MPVAPLVGSRLTLKGSIILITPPGDTRGSSRRARPFVRLAFGSSSGPAVFGSRRARPSAVLDVVSPGGSGQRRPGAPARGAEDRRSGRGRGRGDRKPGFDHAAAPWYSWMSPPSRSRRRTSRVLTGTGTGTQASGSGEARPRARWGRPRL